MRFFKGLALSASRFVTLAGSYPELPCEPLSFVGVRAKSTDKQHGHAEEGWALTRQSPQVRCRYSAVRCWRRCRTLATSAVTCVTGLFSPDRDKPSERSLAAVQYCFVRHSAPAAQQPFGLVEGLRASSGPMVLRVCVLCVMSRIRASRFD